MKAESAAVAGLFWRTSMQLQRISPYFPLWHGVPRVDDQRLVSGIIRHGLRSATPRVRCWKNRS